MCKKALFLTQKYSIILAEVMDVKILKPHEVSKILRVTVKTLQNWDKNGNLVSFRNHKTNRRYYTEEQINNFLGLENGNTRSVVIYTRVSNVGQKNDLKNQQDFLQQYSNAKGYIISEIITDIASGMDFKRKNWNKLLKSIMDRKVEKVIVAHKDRFVRFGFDWFEELCRGFGCEIEVVNNEKLSPQEEMVQDLISIIHIFSCRIYGLRKYKKEIEVDSDVKNI